MPSKIQLDENLYFLYTCLQKSDMKFVGQFLLYQLMSSVKLTRFQLIDRLPRSGRRNLSQGTRRPDEIYPPPSTNRERGALDGSC